MSSATALKRALESAQQQLDSHAGRGVPGIGCICVLCQRAAKFIKEAAHE